MDNLAATLASISQTLAKVQIDLAASRAENATLQARFDHLNARLSPLPTRSPNTVPSVQSFAGTGASSSVPVTGSPSSANTILVGVSPVPLSAPERYAGEAKRFQ